MPLRFSAVKTSTLYPPKDNIFPLFDSESFSLEESDILCIATKCLAIHQGRCIKIGTVDKKQLIRDEADWLLNENCPLTIKDGIVIPFSGIDESNGNGYYILWPQNVTKLLADIHKYLCEKFTVKNLGIMSIDSKIVPFRRGTVGAAQDIFGFNPIKDYKGKVDLFGRELKLTSVNIADSLASVACYLMGEGDECCPLITIRGAENVEFGRKFFMKNMQLAKEDDMFGNILNFHNRMN
ncbi:MAG: coenzyme F420-0:L-glutamate ligase [Puniceicoccales bacterium]|jgi:F420-0:gamma-glutamyl ligase|nr:coenzyme F420-0:L-glutamate ligase [Puniceicoccales bacterium]